MVSIPGILRPQAVISDEDRSRGLRMMNLQAVAASGADGLASGGFLAAFAIILGASNLQIGILTAIPFIMQPIQIFAVVLVERWRARKVIAVSAFFVAYSTWIPIALTPFFIDVPNPAAVSVLLVFVAVRGIANSFVNTSWNSWLRSVVPAEIMGKFFSQRMRMSTLAAAAVGLGAALYIDWWKGAAAAESIIFGYSYAILFGSILLGWSAVGFMSRIPEPQMPEREGPPVPVVKMIAAPYKDGNFRQLMLFDFFRNFSTNLAVPFFTVYMLVRLDMPLTVVVGLGVLSQLSNVLFLRVWGPMVDQFGSKAIISLCSSLYLLVIIGWTFTTMPERYVLTVPLLVILHIFAGVANAGINVSAMTLRMKLAPEAQATAYMTGGSLAINLGAGISPLIGGFFADFFSVREFQVNMAWVDPSNTLQFPALFLTGYDFLFAVSFVVGLITLNLLAPVREEGGVDRDVIMNELESQTRDNFRMLTSVPGMSVMSNIPYSFLRNVPGIPGLDVAVGVTAFQLAATTRDAVTLASRGGTTASEVAGRVSDTVSDAVGQAERVGNRLGLAFAIQATRGAMLAVAETTQDVNDVARGAVRGTLDALGDATSNTKEILRGTGYGVVQGASEAGTDVTEATIQAIEEAKTSARELGLSEDDVAAEVARGALQAAEAQGPEMAALVKDAIIEELIGPASSEDSSETRQS